MKKKIIENIIISQIPPPKTKRKHFFWRVALDVLIYIGIVAGIIFGLPAFLTWKLETPYPMAAITSSSMWPSLKEGDLVFIQGIKDQKEINVGEVIVFRNQKNNTFTIHRIVKIDGKKITTKGDANFKEDEPITFANVIGKTVTLGDKPFHLPHLGAITVFASNFRDEK